MITKEKIEKLKPLTDHEKFGPILIKAIETWKNSNIIANTFGISKYQLGNKFIDGFKYKVSNPSIGCCLIGASVIDLKFKDDRTGNPFEIINQFTKISHDEFYSLIDGFDLAKFGTRGSNNDAYHFGLQVRFIVK